MPYPALPPDLPPVVSVLPSDTTYCSSYPVSTSGESFQSRLSKIATIAHQLKRPTPPETLLPQAVSASTAPTEDSSNLPEPVSCAALLGNTNARGYLTADSKLVTQPAPAPDSEPSPQVTPPVLPRTLKSVAPPERLQPERSPRVEFAPASKNSASTTHSPATPSTSLSHSSSYRLSGVTGKLSGLPEKMVMQELHQAVVFEGLTETYKALSQVSAQDLRQWAKKGSVVAQTSDRPIESRPVLPDSIVPEGTTPVDLPIPQSAPDAPPVVPAPTGETPVQTPDTVIEVTADRQDYDERRQIFIAEGNVMMRFRNALLEADRVQVNLTNRLTLAEGNVALTRGGQVLRGQQFEYNFVQGVGTVTQARGDIFLPSLGPDTAFSPTTPADQTILSRPLSDRITSQQPQANVGSPGGINFSVGAGRDVNRVPGTLPRGGQVRRLRFEAARVDFTPEGWVAETIDITNDPFSPPEFVLRADKAVLTRLSPLEDEVVATRPRLVFDQKVAVPILRRRFLISRAEQEPAFAQIGFDNEDRGGLFIEGIFNVLNTGRLSLTVYPQIFVQRMFTGDEDGITDPDNFGVRTQFRALINDRTIVRARAALTSLNFDQIEEEFRASVRLEHFLLPIPAGFHRLALEYSYRDRLFNGSLGFQTVRSSLGAILTSPDIRLGNSGFVVNYQAGYQQIVSDTDRLDLLDPIRTDNRVELGRFQATAGIGRSFNLWTGKALPATRDQGLNYTPTPITPQINLFTSLRGVVSQYTNGDSQRDLIGTVLLSAQFGHFSRRFFDYTAVGVAYTQVIGSGASPFLFDRTVDNRILSLSFFQQLYGPVRFGVQTSINVDTRDAFSTDIFLEYSRRTHGIILRYNPELEIGSISLRVSDFNWTGTAQPFEGAGVIPVEGGVERR